WSIELGTVFRRIEELRQLADETVTAATTAATAPAARQLEHTEAMIRRLYEEAERLQEEIADIQFALVFEDAADAVSELSARLEVLLDRQQRINEEIRRYERSVSRAVSALGTPRPGMARSIQPSIPSRLQDPLGTRTMAPPPSAFDRVQQQVREYIERGIPVEALSQIQLEGMRRVIRQREELERKYAEALGLQQKGALDLLKSGDIMGAAKAAFLPLL